MDMEFGMPALIELSGRNHCRCVIETKTAAALWQSCRWLETHFK
ncbi:hypothetical protein [Lacrimispora brassicae]